MINRLAAVALLALAAVATTACAGAPAATTTPTAVPIAVPTATNAAPNATNAAPNATPAIAITTAQVANGICMEALMTGKLSRDARTGLGVTAADGQQMPVEWPFGYSARNDGGRIALVDETGDVVAHEGDEIQVGGGFGNVMWHACGLVGIPQAG